jgi:hypothetical protein
METICEERGSMMYLNFIIIFTIFPKAIIPYNSTSSTSPLCISMSLYMPMPTRENRLTFASTTMMY